MCVGGCEGSYAVSFFCTTVLKCLYGLAIILLETKRLDALIFCKYFNKVIKIRAGVHM